MRCVRRACPWNIFCPSSRTTICPLVPGNPSARFIRHPSLQGRMCRAFCSGVDLILLPERFYHPSPPPGYIFNPFPTDLFYVPKLRGDGPGFSKGNTEVTHSVFEGVQSEYLWISWRKFGKFVISSGSLYTPLRLYLFHCTIHVIFFFFCICLAIWQLGDGDWFDAHLLNKR